MRDKLAQSVITAKRVAEERQITADKFQQHLAFTDTVRAARKGDADKRRQAMIAFLEDQAKKWLTPERVDEEITADFLSTPGSLAGFSAERSPYWGFIADVEPLPYKQPPRLGTARAATPRSGNSRNPQEAMALAHHIMKDYSSSYLEYKLMREDPEGVDGLIEMMQELEVFDEATDGQQGPVSMSGLGLPAANGGARGGGGFMGGGPGGGANPYSFQRGAGGGGVGGGGGGWYGGGQRPSMPRVQPDEQDKQKIEEQLARLRARRSRPTPAAPTEPPVA